MNDESERSPQTWPSALSAGKPPLRTPCGSEARGAAWDALSELKLSRRQSDRGRLISLERRDPAHMIFDMLRTRVGQAMKEHGWGRIAVTSPTKGCGKTFVASNLALSLARRKTARVGLMDLDLRMPSLAHVFAVRAPGAAHQLLEGKAPIEAHFSRFGDNLAVAATTACHHDPAERLHAPETGEMLTRIETALGLDLMIFDLPPMLSCDDFLSFLPHVDCALFVAGGGVTRSEEIRRCAKLIEGRKPLLGIILNQAEDPDVERYYYGYEGR